MSFYLQENSEMSQSLIRKRLKPVKPVKRLAKAREESRNGKTEKR